MDIILAGSVMSCTMDAGTVLRVCAVLQDCADQLAVLGHVISCTHRDSTPAAAATEVSEGISVAPGGQVEGRGVSWTVQWELENTLKDRTISKVQSDRRSAAQVIAELLTELTEEGTFYSLMHTVEEEKRTKAQLHDIIIRDKEDRLRIKTLRKHLLDLRKETTLQIQERDRMAAHLEDQLQEWKMKKSLQEKYVHNSTQLHVCQGQKLNSHIEKQLEAEIETLKKKLKEEETAHDELESFLKNTRTTPEEKPASLNEKLEYWMERHLKDTEDKQQELNTVKTNMNNNRTQLQDLANNYRDSEQVIIEDRLEKEKLRKQLEREQLQRKAAIKVQSWWRGTLVRKGLGPFKKSKKPKKKKEGKKAKKK